MSVLEIPRLYFKGQVSWDPVTTNNYSTNYDETDCTTIFPPDVPGIQEEVQKFRDSAVAQVGSQGNWNPHGTYRSSFYDAAVCGLDRGKGASTNDPFVASVVKFSGMLVDLEPFGAYTSQLFFDSMLLGVDGGYLIQLPRTSRVIGRHINFGRNTSKQTAIAGVASVVWTTSFAKTDLRINALDSGILADLSEALRADDVLGLTVRFNAYRTIYYDNPKLTNGSKAMQAEAEALAAKIAGGGFQPNPARSLIVGVLGLWRKGEPTQEPGDRALVPAGKPVVGGSAARFNKDSLVLDLSNSVPEVDADLNKADLGELTVVAVDQAGAVKVTLGSIPYSAYDRASYEATAGLVTLPIQSGVSKNISGLNLQVHSSKGTILQEEAFRAVPLEPNFYLDQGKSTQVAFQVYEHGQPAGAGISLQMNQMSADGSSIESSTQLTTDGGGAVHVSLSASNPGIIAYVPSFTPADTPTSGLNTQVNTYMYVRVLPADEKIAALPPTWPNVYKYVLANWNAMAPCMDNWLRLDDPAQIRAHAQILKRLTSSASFELFRFMPITRDMSPGMRSLLYGWLDSPPDAAAEIPSRVRSLKMGLRKQEAVEVEAQPTLSLEEMTQTELSRSMRGGPKGN